MASCSAVEEREPAYVSTGHLPAPDTVHSLVNKTPRHFKSNRDGENSQVYPALAREPSELRLALALTEGGCHDDLRS
jgi:hypothetical protein